MTMTIEQRREKNREKSKRWRANNPDKSKQSDRENYYKHRVARLAQKREWALRHKEVVRARNAQNAIKFRFRNAVNKTKTYAKKWGGVPVLATEDEVGLAFTGMCHNPGCGVKESVLKRRLHLDHDHVTGKFRGWLCGSCNSMLNNKRRPDEIRRVCRQTIGLAKYLEGVRRCH